MTEAQRVMLMIDLPAKNGRPARPSLFTQAATIQGWKKSDRTLRLKVFSLAVTFGEFSDQLEFRDALENYDLIRSHPPANVQFRHLESATELNHTTDVDAVKTALLMLADNLNAAREQGKPEFGAARRWREVIADHQKCLALFPLHQPMGMAGAEAFIQTLINYKFNYGKVGKITLEDLDERPGFGPNKKTGKMEEKPSQVEQLLWTVNARLNGKTGFRAKAGFSMHDMYLSAGLPCSCKLCFLSNQRSLMAGFAEGNSLVMERPNAPQLKPAGSINPDLGAEGLSEEETPF